MCVWCACEVMQRVCMRGVREGAYEGECVCRGTVCSIGCVGACEWVPVCDACMWV